jgi:hypothetical protein
LRAALPLIAELEDALKSGSAAIERLLKKVQPDGLIVASKAAQLTRPTVCNILKTRFAHHSISEKELDEAKAAFLAISQNTAQRTFRFMLIQQKMRCPDVG